MDMRINIINNNISFRSGLNKNIVRNCLRTNVSDVEIFLSNKKIDSDFQLCKTVAFLTKSVINILDTFKKQTDAKLFIFSIPSISLYTIDKLSFPFKGINFCIPESQIVFSDKKEFKTGSLFFERNDDIELLNYKLDKSFTNNERSSSHYLSPFIHEFMHNAYLNYIYSKYGYEGSCYYTKQKYYSDKKQNIGLNILQKLQVQTFDDSENKIIENTIGKYATCKQNQYHEVFAETFTKLICESLSSDGKPNKNPFELLRCLDQNFLNILKKIFV